MAEVNSWPALLGQAATQAPHPMQAAASMAASAAVLGTGMMLASTAEPVLAEMKPPASMMASSGLRSTMRSRRMGNDAARNGSMVMCSPSWNLRMCSWQVAVPFWGPWAWPLIMRPQVPQMPSRQSLSNTMGSRPSSMSFSLTTSSISRKDMSSLMPMAS